MEQKFIITDNSYDVNDLILKGWRIVSITAQHVATGSAFSLLGKFAILLERESSRQPLG
jgi:hypothetical protein